MLEGKKVLITGHTGQVGGAIARVHAPRCEMWGLARYSKPGSKEAAEAIGIRPVVGDFTKGEFDEVPDDFDYVLHFAASTRPGTAEAGMVENAEGAGLLMHHCRKAKAFLQISTNSVYSDNPDPFHAYKETDHVGTPTLRAPNYGGTKLAGEGVVRTLAKIHNLPTTIARLNVAYGGPYFDGGLPGRQLQALIDGVPIRLTRGVRTVLCPIHEDDLTAHVGPLLQAAAVPATITNWAGDVAVPVEEWVRYLADLIGVEPNIEFIEGRTLPSFVSDNSKRLSLGCVCKVDWKTGMRRMVERRHPELKLRPPA